MEAPKRPADADPRALDRMGAAACLMILQLKPDPARTIMLGREIRHEITKNGGNYEPCVRIWGGDFSNSYVDRGRVRPGGRAACRLGGRSIRSRYSWGNSECASSWWGKTHPDHNHKLRRIFHF